MMSDWTTFVDADGKALFAHWSQTHLLLTDNRNGPLKDRMALTPTQAARLRDWLTAVLARPDDADEPELTQAQIDALSAAMQAERAKIRAAAIFTRPAGMSVEEAEAIVNPPILTAMDKWGEADAGVVSWRMGEHSSGPIKPPVGGECDCGACAPNPAPEHDMVALRKWAVERSIEMHDGSFITSTADLMVEYALTGKIVNPPFPCALDGETA
jgi:hypothetical protein